MGRRPRLQPRPELEDQFSLEYRVEEIKAKAAIRQIAFEEARLGNPWPLITHLRDRLGNDELQLLGELFARYCTGKTGRSRSMLRGVENRVIANAVEKLLADNPEMKVDDAVGDVAKKYQRSPRSVYNAIDADRKLAALPTAK